MAGGKMEKKKFKINLQLFAEPGEGEGATPPAEGEKTGSDPEKLIPKSRLDEVITKSKEKDVLIAQLQAKEKQYETYVPADKLTEAQATAKAEADAKINDFAIKADLKVSLIEKGFTAKQIDLILSQADTTGLKRDGEKVIGLNDVTEKLYGEYKEVFGLKALGVNNTGAGAGGQAPGAGYTAEQLSKMSDAEYFAYKESLKK
jgi:hypothetical protein